MLSQHALRRIPLRSLPLARRYAHTPAPQLRPVTASDVEHFASLLPATSILSTLPPISSAKEELQPFNDDWMNKYHGRASTVLRPRSTAEVADIVRWCNEKRIGVVPQGGNTGLVGGGVPVKDELVLSLGNMSKIRSFDPVSGESPAYIPRITA